MQLQQVLVAEDHPLFRSALTEAVRRAAPEAKVVGCSTIAETMTWLTDCEACIVLLDLKLSDCDGFAGLLAIRAKHPALPVVVVSAHEGPETIRNSLVLGASGFIPKSADISLIEAALKAILLGEIWHPGYAGPPDAAQGRPVNLTPTQVRILSAMQDGKLNKQIAHELGLSEATVKGHITEIFRKMGVVNRTQAVLAGRELRLP